MPTDDPNKTGERSNNASEKPTESREEMLAELKAQYIRDLDWNSAQDNKADKMITMSSALATLLIALGTFLVSRIESSSWVFIADIVTLFVGIILAASAIAFFINAFKIREFSFPLRT